MIGIIERLRRSFVTAQNDDLSEPLSEKRDRHIARQEAIQDAIDVLGLLVWQPIETAPKDRRILGWDGAEILTLDFSKHGEYWQQISDSGRSSAYYPTNWMPLPNRPQRS